MGYNTALDLSEELELDFSSIRPEVLIHTNHSYTADYFALGVLTYELMIGRVI